VHTVSPAESTVCLTRLYDPFDFPNHPQLTQLRSLVYRVPKVLTMTVLYYICTGMIVIILNCMINILSTRWQNNPINERREISSSNRTEDLAPDNGSRFTSTSNSLVATTRDDQEPDMSQVESPVPSAKAALEGSKPLSTYGP
jgi:hypothetical protein